MLGAIVEVEFRNKARKYLERMNEPHKSMVVDALNKLEREPLVIEPADVEETAMIEEGMREYEKDPSAFTPWKTVKNQFIPSKTAFPPPALLLLTLW